MIPSPPHKIQKKIKPEESIIQSTKKEPTSFLEHTWEWIKGFFGGGVTQNTQIDVSISKMKIIQRNIEYKQSEIGEASLYIDRKMTEIEKKVYENIAEPFSDAWNKMFKEINNEILNGKSYNEIYEKYGEGWQQFQIGFDEVFSYAGKGLNKKQIADLKTYQGTNEFHIELKILHDGALYEDFKNLFAIFWEKELQDDVQLKQYIQLIATERKIENALIAQLLKQAGNLKIDLEDSIRNRYEKILNEAKIYDYSDEEIKIAQLIISKFWDAFKEHFDSKIDMRLWRTIVAREPMLAKAERLLFQKQYDNIKIEYQRRELLEKKKLGELTPDELAIIEKGYLDSFKEGISLFFKTMLPWNQIEGPESLREEKVNVVLNVMPVTEMGHLLASFARFAAGDVAANIITDYANRLDKASIQLSTEITEGLQNLKKAGQWNVDKNRYIVQDFTHDAKEGSISRGIKTIMQTMVEPPEHMKSKKMIPWLAKYAKAGVAGAAVAVGRELWNLRMPTTTTVIKGAVAGMAVERFKGEIKAGIIFGLPGAIALGGVAIAIGIGALSGPVGWGVLLAVGIAAVLFALFGVWVMYGTKIGENIRETIANFVYSSELEWFDKLERSNLGRISFDQAAKHAEARRGQMYMRTELAQDTRYQNLVDICREMQFSKKAQNAFLEQIQRNPHSLSEPDHIQDVLAMIKAPKILAEFNALNEFNESKIDPLINMYRSRNRDILKLGLNGRYENLKTELQKFDPKLIKIIDSFERDKNLLEYDDHLKVFLKNEGISSETIDKVFSELTPDKKSLNDSWEITKTAYVVAHTVGSITNSVSNIGAYLGSSWNIGKSAEEIEAAELLKNLRNQNEYDYVNVVLALRKLVKQKDLLVDEGQLKNLLISLGFQSDQVDALYKVYDKQVALADTKSIKAKMFAEQNLIRSGIQGDILAFDIIVEAQKKGDLKSDADLPTDEELEDIRRNLPSDAKVLAMINRDEKLHIPSNIPNKIPNKIPNDRVLMLRFGLLKRDAMGNIIPLDKLSEEDQKFFTKKKTAYRNNFDKLRIGLKRAELMQSEVGLLVQRKKDDYVAKVIQAMPEEAQMKRITKRNLEILEDYKAR